MEKRIQARTNNYQLDSLVRRKPWGYGFIEERHFDSAYIFIALDLTGMVYEIDPAKAKVGPAIFRCGDIRGKCDQQPMMYVNETGVKFLYRSKFRPGQANSTQTFTSANRLLEEQMVKEYVQWRSGEYLPPTYSKRVGTHLCMDDGGIRIKI
jgi:hypothetical protein